MKKLLITLCFAAVASVAMAAEEPEFSYVPQVHGAFRTRWEVDAKNGDNRFQVRNARLSIEGKIAPSVAYFLQTDLCDGGVIKILDAYGTVNIVKGLQLKAGQFRMPFGVEPRRAPNNYFFANRSFMGKQVMNYRAVGAQVGYTLSMIPLTVEFGAFNPATIGNHNIWNRTVAYSGRATYQLGEVALSASYGSIRPNGIRANLVDGSVVWNDKKHWMVAGEYMHKTYCNGAQPVDTWLGFVDWHKDVKAGVFNRWSIQVREDGMTDHLKMDGSAIEPGRDRITLGSTLTFAYKAVHFDVRANYEKYFYHKDVEVPVGDSDRVVAELVIRF